MDFESICSIVSEAVAAGRSEAGALSDETIEATLALENIRLDGEVTLTDAQIQLLLDGFALIEGSETNEEKSRYFEGLGLGLGVAEGGVDVAAAGDADADTAAAAAAAAADDDDGDDDNDPFAKLDIGTIECASFHENLEEGGVLDGKSAIWRAPEDYGSLRCAVTMLERAVLERQVRGALEATHPSKEELERALRFGVDNAEVAQSKKMLELDAQRQDAETRNTAALDNIKEAKRANEDLAEQLALARSDAQSKHDAHSESYATMKTQFVELIQTRRETNEKHAAAMAEAQAALDHVLRDKADLLAEIEGLYPQLASTSGRQNRATVAAAAEHENLRSVQQLAKRREAKLENEVKNLRQALEKAQKDSRRLEHESGSASVRYRSETDAKIRLLEETIRLQDESEVIATEAREQIRDEIQTKFDRQLRALLTEIEEAEDRNRALEKQVKTLSGGKGGGSASTSEVDKLRAVNEKLAAENRVLRSKEVRRKQKEEKMAELAAVMVKEAQANEKLSARLKETQARLDEFTRRGLVATSVQSLRSMVPPPPHWETSAMKPHRLSLPSYGSGAPVTRSPHFNDAVQKKIDSITADIIGGSTIFNSPAGSSSSSSSANENPAPPPLKGKVIAPIQTVSI